MSLTTYISSIIPLSEAIESSILKIAVSITVPKNVNLIETGKLCSDIYFIEQGLIRGYYYDEAKEITGWFAQENEFASGFYSFVTGKPSFEIIETLEDCELIKINKKDLFDLYDQFPQTERIGRMITENYYIKLEERFISIQFKTAKERYLHLMQHKPSLIQRAPLGQIASYLGITQETLSRIRAEI